MILPVNKQDVKAAQAKPGQAKRAFTLAVFWKAILEAEKGLVLSLMRKRSVSFSLGRVVEVCQAAGVALLPGCLVVVGKWLALTFARAVFILRAVIQVVQLVWQSGTGVGVIGNVLWKPRKSLGKLGRWGCYPQQCRLGKYLLNVPKAPINESLLTRGAFYATRT